MKWFNVYLNGRLIDSVPANGYTRAAMRISLINHDGYDARIKVCLARKGQ